MTSTTTEGGERPRLGLLREASKAGSGLQAVNCTRVGVKLYYLHQGLSSSRFSNTDGSDSSSREYRIGGDSSRGNHLDSVPGRTTGPSHLLGPLPHGVT